ncbi:hypothetical protein JVU11DRAFT_423 [Chiua virens]|nr:hypothetical protein JVU11DRAFT_423 [Chiua virens]
MSCKNDFQAIRPLKKPCLFDSCSCERAGPSTRSWHSRIYSSSSLPVYSSTSQANFDYNDLLDPVDEIALESDLDQRTASSATLLSHRVSQSLSTHQFSPDISTSFEFDLPTRLSESCSSHALYSLHEPGQRTARRVQRLRHRTASVIMSIPATCEDGDGENEELRDAPPEAQRSKLRRISGVRDLRRVFRESEHGSANSASVSPLEPLTASYELGFIVNPVPPPSALSTRSSLRTLVELGIGRPTSAGDLKTLCGSTLGSISITSRFTAKIHSTFSLSLSLSQTHTSHSILSKKPFGHSSPIVRQRRHASLNDPVTPSRSPANRDESVWSCAKISQSAIKRAARCGHMPRRIFSQPIGALAS